MALKADSADQAVALWRSIRQSYPRVGMERLASACRGTSDGLRHPVVGDAQQALSDLLPGLQPNFTVMVMGLFSSGKSTLINAIIGRDLLGARATQCTRLLTIIRASSQESGAVCWPDGQREELGLTDAASLPANQTSRHDGAQCWVELSVDEPLLDGCLLVDSPGFDDPDHFDHENCLRQLERADCVLWVVPANRVGKELDRGLLDRIPRETAVIGVLTKRDRVKGELQDCLRGARQLLGERVEHWVAVDSKSALSSRLSGDAAGSAESGVPELLRRLQGYRLDLAGMGKLGRRYQIIARHWDAAEEALVGRRQALQRTLDSWGSAISVLLAIASMELRRCAMSLATEALAARDRVLARGAQAKDRLVASRVEPGFASRLTSALKWDDCDLPYTKAEAERVQASRRLVAKASELRGKPIDVAGRTVRDAAALPSVMSLARRVGRSSDGSTDGSSPEVLLKLIDFAGPERARHGVDPTSIPDVVWSTVDFGDTEVGKLANAALESAGAKGAANALSQAPLLESSKPAPLQGVTVNWTAHDYLWGLGNWLQTKVTGSAFTAYDTDVLAPLGRNLTSHAGEVVAHYLRFLWSDITGQLEATTAVLTAAMCAEWDGDPGAIADELADVDSQLASLRQARRDLQANLSLFPHLLAGLEHARQGPASAPGRNLGGASGHRRRKRR